MTTLVFAAIFAASCSQADEIYPDLEPQKAILGKWELVEAGWNDNMSSYTSNEYLEYLPDSILRVYDNKENRFTSETTYWLKDSILYSGAYVDGVFHGVKQKYYFFDNNNKLRLEFHEMTAIIPIAVYKRVK